MPKHIIEGRFVICQAVTNLEINVKADAVMINEMFNFVDVAAEFREQPAQLLARMASERVMGDFQLHAGRVVAAAHTELRWEDEE